MFRFAAKAKRVAAFAGCWCSMIALKAALSFDAAASLALSSPYICQGGGGGRGELFRERKRARGERDLRHRERRLLLLLSCRFIDNCFSLLGLALRETDTVPRCRPPPLYGVHICSVSAGVTSTAHGLMPPDKKKVDRYCMTYVVVCLPHTRNY